MTMRPVTLCLALVASLAHAAIPPPDPPVTAKERAQGFRDHIVLAKPLAQRRASAYRDEARDGVRVRQSFARFGDLRVIVLDDAEAADHAVARLRATGRYEFVEHDRFFRAAAVPNDPGFSQQWALQNTGGSGGVWGADIKAVAAWDVIHDASDVIVAILDSGVNINHTDIAANIWNNPAPTFGDVHGASFINGVRSGDPSDVMGHGTHVAGIVGATGNNGNAMSGVAWRVQIMPVRIMSAEGLIATSDFAAGVDYAISHGAHIMNASLFTDTHSQADLTIIAAAREAGVILVVAAGNEAQNLDATPHYYPGSYPLDNIVSVGASTRSETLASFSNYGAAVDLVAPGEAIISLYYGNNVGGVTLSGTSMASPHVAGALALIKAHFPADNHRQLINRLLRGAEVLPAYAGKAQTGGRLNLLAALTNTDNRPFNDSFAARARLGGPSLGIRSSNAGASAEAGEPAHAGVAASATLWWEWTAPASDPVTLDTLGSGFDTTLAVYSGNNLATLTPVVANDNDGANQTSRVALNPQAGSTYQIAVGGRNGASGLVMLNLGRRPPNDAFAAAAALTGASTQVTGANNLGSRETGEPRILNFASGASVWYRWTAPRSGRFQIAATSLDLDVLLAVYTGGAVDALTLVAASDNIARGSENIDSLCTIEAVADVTYAISVDSKQAANAGEFTLSITDSLWQAATLRNLNGAPAVAADGTVYVGSTDFNAYAFNPDGSDKWRFGTGDSFDRSTPAVGGDGTVYVYSLDGKLHALRADGTLRWTRDFGVTPSLTVTAKCSSPAIAADGTLHLKAGDGYLYALNPADGATSWRFNVNATATYASPVIAADGTIYQGSDSGQLYAFNPAGTLKWSFSADGRILCAPAIDAAGNVYFDTGSSGKLWCVTAAGVLRWTYAGATAGSSSSPALSAGGSTVYFGAQDRKLHAVNAADGTARWTFTLGGEVGDSSPAVDADGVVYIGCHDHRLYAVTAAGGLKRTYDTGAPIDSSPAIFGRTLYIGSDDAKLYAYDIGADSAGGPWPQFRQNASRLGRAIAAPTLAMPLTSQTAAAGATITLSVTATVPAGSPAPTYQWQRNGANLSGATNPALTLDNLQPANTGVYRTLIVNAAGSADSGVAIVGLATTDKVFGAGEEIGWDIHHQNGNTFDQVLLKGAAETITADYNPDPAKNQITRTSFVDIDDDIVQVEFSGPGTLSLVLDSPTGPATPVNYNQATTYMKGHAGIVITGATEATNVAVFSVGRITAVNQALFKDNVTYDGIADIAFIAIASANGKFGGVRTSNANYFATKGLTGVYAPGVAFEAVFIGNITAFEAATPVIQLGSVKDARVTGGDLAQPNDAAVQVSGLAQLRFTAGIDSHGRGLPAEANKAVLKENGVDVTAQVVVNP